MTAQGRSTVFLAAGLIFSAACSGIAGAAHPRDGVGVVTDDSVPTLTNLDDIDLNDTTEDPAYADAGEALAKDVASGVIGEAAPPATLTTIDGVQIDLASIYGKKPVYLKFWATWCTPCRQQTPGFEKAYKAFGDKIQFVAVNMGFSDDIASVRAFKRKYGMSMPIVIDDGSLAGRFHVKVTPQHVLIGRDARIAYIGHAENEALENALAQAAGEQEGEGAAGAPPVAVEAAIGIRDLIPDRSVNLVSGEIIPLKAKPGGFLAIQFFSSWCEWYLESSRPQTSEACARFREAIAGMSNAIPQVEWIGVAGGLWTTAQDLLDYKKNHNVSIPLALDENGDLFRMFGIRDIPTIALVNDTQRLIGLIGPAETNLLIAVRALLAGHGEADPKLSSTDGN